MKTRSILLVVCLAVLTQGCLVRSLHPFFKTSDVVFREELLASWTDDEGASWRMERKAGTNAYELHWLNHGDRNVAFTAHLFNLDGQLYLDCFPQETDEKEPTMELFNDHLMPIHTIARVELSNNNNYLVIKWFNEEWLHKMLKENRIMISNEVVTEAGEDEGIYVLTASTSELQKFIMKYGQEPEAFSDDGLWLKLTRNGR